MLRPTRQRLPLYRCHPARSASFALRMGLRSDPPNWIRTSVILSVAKDLSWPPPRRKHSL